MPGKRAQDREQGLESWETTTLKIPAKEEGLENEVRDKRKEKKKKEDFHRKQRREDSQGGIG